MKVETFEVTEVGSEGKVDNFEEVSQLADKLNLEGQKLLLNPEKKEICPYRKMTSQEKVVYGALLQEKSKLNKYSEGIIPLRVLQVASHALELGIIDFCEVWHKPNADIKDPILVGVKGNEWSGERFILARWGEELESFTELMQKATHIIAYQAKSKLLEIQEEVRSKLASIEPLVESNVRQGKNTSFTFYNS